MGLLQTVWQKRIMENLYEDISFLDKGQNWDEYVQQGIKTVVIPQSGSPAGFERNRTTYPAAVNQRADTDISFDMVDYTSNPQHVLNLDAIQVSYNKMQSVLDNQLLDLKDGVAKDIMYAWRPEVANVIDTTGDTVPTNLVGSTGNRKKTKFVDLITAGKVLNKQLIPASGRILLVTADMYADLLTDPDVKDKFNPSLANLNTGVLGTLAGFTLMQRATTLHIGTDKTTKVPTAAVVATDSELAIAWHPGFVGRSVGNIEVFYNIKDATMFGNVLSSQLQAGGKKCYTNGRGVVGIRPTNV